jgi:hypothetical protein
MAQFYNGPLADSEALPCNAVLSDGRFIDGSGWVVPSGA